MRKRRRKSIRESKRDKANKRFFASGRWAKRARLRAEGIIFLFGSSFCLAGLIKNLLEGWTDEAATFAIALPICFVGSWFSFGRANEYK